MSDSKRVNQSAERNRGPILEILRKTLDLGRPLKCLEIASGSGTHVGYFAQHLPEVTWQPSDCDPENLPSLRAYAREKENILEPIVIDISKSLVMDDFKPDIILCINMIHISPWVCTLGLIANAGRYFLIFSLLNRYEMHLYSSVAGQLLREGGQLITYGPYKHHGVLQPESNQQFDQSLRGMNWEWGIRDTRDIETEAAREGLELTNIVEMPANNKMLIFSK